MTDDLLDIATSVCKLYPPAIHQRLNYLMFGVVKLAEFNHLPI